MQSRGEERMKRSHLHTFLWKMTCWSVQFGQSHLFNLAFQKHYQVVHTLTLFYQYPTKECNRIHGIYLCWLKEMRRNLSMISWICEGERERKQESVESALGTWGSVYKKYIVQKPTVLVIEWKWREDWGNSISSICENIVDNHKHTFQSWMLDF